MRFKRLTPHFALLLCFWLVLTYNACLYSPLMTRPDPPMPAMPYLGPSYSTSSSYSSPSSSPSFPSRSSTEAGTTTNCENGMCYHDSSADYRAIAEAIDYGGKEGFGDCLWKKEKAMISFPEETSPFTEVFMQAWEKKPKLPVVIDLKTNRELSRRELRTIDALARTIYGEMSDSCVDRNLGFAYAASSTIRERARAVACQLPSGKSYSKSVGRNKTLSYEADMSVYERVVSAPLQYSVWNNACYYTGEQAKFCPKGFRSENPSLRTVLCPITNSARWKASLQLAKEMVLSPQRFDSVKPSYMNCVFNYVAGMDGPWKGMCPLNGTLVQPGNRCVEAYKPCDQNKQACESCTQSVDNQALLKPVGS